MASLVSNPLLQICFFVVLTCGSPIQKAPSEAPDIEKYIRDALENFRSEMTKGLPNFDIPSFEPLVFRDIALKTSNNNFDINLQLHEVGIEGLSTFEIQDLHADISKMSFRIRAKFSKLAAKGRYFVDGKILRIIPIYGEGDYGVAITDISVGAETSLILGEESIELRPIKLHLSWTDIHLNLKNFLGGGSFSEVLQKALPDLAKRIYNQLRDVILDKASIFITGKLNALINSSKVKEQIQQLIAKAHMGKLG